MDYERERGRIRGHTTTREKMIDFAKQMIPIFRKARLELPNRDGTGPSLKAYADWLNERKYLTREGESARRRGSDKPSGRWHPETVSRQLDVHLSGIDEIEKEYEIAAAMRSYILKHPNYERRDERLAELANIEEIRETSIIEMHKLAADLRGQPYVATPIPPPAAPGSKRLTSSRPRREKQLKLFPDME